MKKLYIITITLSLLLLSGCSNSTSKNQPVSIQNPQTSEKNMIQNIENSNYEATPEPDAQSEQPANASCSHNMPYSNLPLTLESIPKRLSSEHINQLFEYTYDNIKNNNQNDIYEGKSSILENTLDFPLLSTEHNIYFYFPEIQKDLKPSYITCSDNYEFQPLNELQIYSSMTLDEILKLNENYYIKEYKIDNQSRSYIQITTDQYEFFLQAYNEDHNIDRIIIKRKGFNEIDEAYNSALDLIEKFSQYKGSPIFYNKGNINQDGYEDLMITFSPYEDSLSEEEQQQIYDSFLSNRVTLILFGTKNSFIKYGEVMGLIESNGGTFGEPLIDININDGKISINQYGGSSWRWNWLSLYAFDNIDNEIYLTTKVNSGYHCVRPVNDTYSSILNHYNKTYTILDQIPNNNFYEYDEEIFLSETVTITYPIFKNPKDEKEQAIFKTLSQHTQELINQVADMNVEGEFEINVFPNTLNDKLASLSIYINGKYNDSTKDLQQDTVKYYYEKSYINIDLVNLKVINLTDHYSIDEINKVLYDSYIVYHQNNETNKLTETLLTKEEMKSIVENALIYSNNESNALDYYYNDFSVTLILKLANEKDYPENYEAIFHRTDDLIYEDMPLQ